MPVDHQLLNSSSLLDLLQAISVCSCSLLRFFLVARARCGGGTPSLALKGSWYSSKSHADWTSTMPGCYQYPKQRKDPQKPRTLGRTLQVNCSCKLWGLSDDSALPIMRQLCTYLRMPSTELRLTLRWFRTESQGHCSEPRWASQLQDQSLSP